MGFKAELQCPQCGANVELDEGDQLLACPYCNTRSFFTAPGSFRFVLPQKFTGDHTFYVPYFRFRGSIFTCYESSIRYRIGDITQLGIDLSALPPSLGFRPQALKLLFATPDMPGTILKNMLDVDKAVAGISTYQEIIAERVYHEAHIGEVVSLIYLPLAVKKGVLHDGITGDAFAKLPDSPDILDRMQEASGSWQMTPMATICPKCGWNLEGASGSVALSCSNCDTLWEASPKGFTRLPYIVYTVGNKNILYLPFWRITATCNGINVQSVADFIRVTNQPRLPKKEWENLPMQFWCPAFKIRPKIFLQLASQLTLSQGKLTPMDGLPNGRLHPVTLAKSEALQSLKIILANSATGKKKIMQLLPETTFAITNITLAYVPFTDSGYSLYQEELRANLNKKILELGALL